MSRRRQPPTYIDVTRAETANADYRREWAAGASRPSAPSEPSAWEAQPEPGPAPQPKPSAPKRLVIRSNGPDGSVVLPPDEARAVKAVLRELESGTSGTARTAAAQARQTLNRRTTGRL